MTREKLIERGVEIIRMLNIFSEKKLGFIVVGGYAISTYKKRFSIDLDIVILEKDLGGFEELLLKNKYSLNYDKNIEVIYGEKFKRFLKKIKNLPVNIDLLINGLVSRITNASWSFEYIKKHSDKRKLDNIEFLVPERDLLVAMKFHSGRLSDIRDIVALIPCDYEALKKHLLKGDVKKLKENIEKQGNFLEKPQFDDSFKGIFGVHVYNQKDVEETKNLIKELEKSMKWYH